MTDATDVLLLADLEYKLQAAVHLDCECAPYLINNRERLLPKMIEAAVAQGREVDELIARFVAGAHKRHQSPTTGEGESP